MSKEFHAIIVDKSLKDLGILNQLNVIGETKDGGWVLYKISVPEEDIDKTTRLINENLTEGSWYYHFYNEDGSKLIIVFREKICKTDNNPENWDEAIKYGQSINIPKEQLDFCPKTFAEEKY